MIEVLLHSSHLPQCCPAAGPYPTKVPSQSQPHRTIQTAHACSCAGLGPSCTSLRGNKKIEAPLRGSVCTLMSSTCFSTACSDRSRMTMIIFFTDPCSSPSCRCHIRDRVSPVQLRTLCMLCSRRKSTRLQTARQLLHVVDDAGVRRLADRDGIQPVSVKQVRVIHLRTH